MGANIGGPIEKQQEYTVIPRRSVVCEQPHSACICGIAGKNILDPNDLGNVRALKTGEENYTLNCVIARRMLRYHFRALLHVLGRSGSTATRNCASSMKSFSGRVSHFWVSLSAMLVLGDSVTELSYRDCNQRHLMWSKWPDPRSLKSVDCRGFESDRILVPDRIDRHRSGGRSAFRPCSHQLEIPVCQP